MNAYLLAQVAPPIVSPELQSKAELWAYLIAVVTPLVIAAIKKVVPTVPKVALPCIAPFVGLLGGIGMNALVGSHLSWIDGASLGMIGVFVREVVDQARKAANKAGTT